MNTSELCPTYINKQLFILHFRTVLVMDQVVFDYTAGIINLIDNPQLHSNEKVVKQIQTKTK